MSGLPSPANSMPRPPEMQFAETQSRMADGIQLTMRPLLDNRTTAPSNRTPKGQRRLGLPPRRRDINRRGLVVCPGQPTLPSSEIATSFWASTANSIGRDCRTSLQKPLTTRCDGFFFVHAALAAVEELVVIHFGRCGFVFDAGRVVAALDIRHGMRAAFVADQQAVALREVT